MTLAGIYISYQNLVYVKENIDSFKMQNEVHVYNTRSKFDLVTPHMRLSKSHKSHSYQQYLLFNKLPLAIRLLPNNKFKMCVAKWLKSNVFYTVEEYLGFDFEANTSTVQ